MLVMKQGHIDALAYNVVAQHDEGEVGPGVDGSTDETTFCPCVEGLTISLVFTSVLVIVQVIAPALL